MCFFLKHFILAFQETSFYNTEFFSGFRGTQPEFKDPHCYRIRIPIREFIVPLNFRVSFWLEVFGNVALNRANSASRNCIVGTCLLRPRNFEERTWKNNRLNSLQFEQTEGIHPLK